MPYEVLEDAPTSDVGFRAWGVSIDECFQAAAEATLAVMLENPTVLQRPQRRSIHLEAETLDLALLGLLQEIIFFKDAESLFVAPIELHVRQREAGWQVDATLGGELIDPKRHLLSGDVKAVTMHRFGVEKTGGGWEATVVLDV